MGLLVEIKNNIMRYLIIVIFIFYCSNVNASRLEHLYLESEIINNNKEGLYYDPNDIVIGNQDAKVTIVEFFDYNCGYCELALDDINDLLEQNPNIRVILKEYPILNDNSYDLSKLSIAAGFQGKYFEFHNKLLLLKGKVTYDDAIKIAENLGLNIDRLEEDYNSKQVNDMIANNKVLGYSLAVTGTPAYFIGDVKLEGAVGLETLQEVISFVENGINVKDYIVELARGGDSEAYKVMVRYGLF